MTAPATIPGSIPWRYCADDFQPRNAGERQDTKEARNVCILHDPDGVYSGWLDYHSWAISATAHQHGSWQQRSNGTRRLLPPDPPHFADGTRFLIKPWHCNTEPTRVVVIVNGDAVDIEHGQRLSHVRDSGAVAWVKL